MTLTTWPARWPASARDVADGIVNLSKALRDADTDAVADAVTDLAAQNIRVEDVYAAMLRTLLEAAHPDGLDGDDIGSVVRDAAARDVGPDAVAPNDLVTVILGTLGVHPEPERQVSDDDSQDPDDHREQRQTFAARMSAGPAIRASAVITESLLARIGSSITDVVTMVVDDIAAAETIEWP
ncbi:MAG: hypothetical protein WBA00_02325 [Rhodococcus sp. (in: high G+C Gram-positive bacteria)]